MFIYICVCVCVYACILIVKMVLIRWSRNDVYDLRKFCLRRLDFKQTYGNPL